jgi:tRNA(Arg) A34 adenosine deaminase TadA
MSSEISLRYHDALHRFNGIDESVKTGIVDTSPTLEAWASIRPILEDRMFLTKVMAAAYDASVYSLNRYRRGDPNAMDLPIGAAIGDPTTGLFYVGFASDKELDDPLAHAEVMAIRHYKDLNPTTQLGGLSLASTLEPCPSCLKEIHESGFISRVTYGASREKLEDSDIMKRHKLKASDLVRNGRLNGLYPFEFFQFPDGMIQTAVLEIFASFTRDVDTEKVAFDPRFSQATRCNLFSTRVDETRTPKHQEPEHARHQPPEDWALYDHFLEVLDSFGRPVTLQKPDAISD